MRGGKRWNGSVKKQTDGTYRIRFRRWEDRFKANPWSERRAKITRKQADAFLRSMNDEWDRKEAGLFDPHVDAAQKPIADHLSAFEAHMREKTSKKPRKRVYKHAEQVMSRLTKAITSMSVQTLADLCLDRATRYLARLREVDGRTVKTRNDVMAVLKQFGRWCERTDRVAKNPLDALQKVKPVEREHRQALTAEQVHRLCAGAIQRTVQNRAAPKKRAEQTDSARRRALALLLGFLAGLRNNECANLTWGMVSFLDAVIDLPAHITKSGRQESVPLHEGLGDVLRAWQAEQALALRRPVAGSDLVVGYLDARGNPTLPVHIAERIREDAEFVGIVPIDGEGRVLDFHAMRTSLANALDEAVPDAIVGMILRHRNPGVTRKHYRRTDARKLLGFINEIPREIAHVGGLIAPPDTHQDRPRSGMPTHEQPTPRQDAI